MLRLFSFLTLVSLFMLPACGSSTSEKGEETPMPAADGKSDTWWAPTLHGELRFGEEDRGNFDGPLGERKFHAWDFSLSGSGLAEVTLTTAPIDLNVDTVAYLYGWNEAEESWGSYLARNDDHGDSVGSRLQESLEAGSYRVVIKGYKDSVQGSFSIVGLCSGASCPAAPTPSDLGADEAAKIEGGVDNLCGDTFCGGDFNWWVASITCAWGTGCTIVWDAKSYYEEDAFPTLDWLEQFPADQLTATGTTSDSAGPYLVTVEKMVDRASDGYWARASCELAVPYAGFDELYETSGGSFPTQTFSDQIMDCVGSIEQILHSILPAAATP